MNARRVVLQGLTSLVGFAISNAAWAGIISFHPESAIYAGNGCPQGSTRISVDDYGDLLMEHDALSLDLPAYGTNQALAGRSTCSIRVPLTIPRGFYVKAIEQRLIYAANKSAGAEARIATRTALSGDTVTPFTVLLARDDKIYSESLIDSRRDQIDSRQRRQQYCSSERSEEMMLQVNIAISGQRDSIAEDLTVRSFGGYVGEGFEIEIGACP